MELLKSRGGSARALDVGIGLQLEVDARQMAHASETADTPSVSTLNSTHDNSAAAPHAQSRRQGHRRRHTVGGFF